MNTYIGNPLDVLKQYSNLKEYRSIATMTVKECEVILSLATDNGNWKGDAVNHLKITSAYSNFVEGSISFGQGDTYNFSICYDGTVDINKMYFDEIKLEFIPVKKIQVYRFSDIVFYMLKCGFNLIEHLK